MKLYYGGYGHHPSGKQYVYYGSDNLRAGQNVVAPVTHWKSGKNYKTMFTIQRSGSFERNKKDVLQRTMAESEVNRLDSKGINIKTLDENENLSTLPGSQPFNRKQEWKAYSDYVYKERVKARLSGKPAQLLTPEQYRNLNKKPPKPKQKEFRLKGVTIGDVITGRKKIKTPNLGIKSKIVKIKDKNGKYVKDEKGQIKTKKVYDVKSSVLNQFLPNKFKKAYLPQTSTKKVWNTDTWEYEKKTEIKYPETPFSRLKASYNVDNFANRLDAKKRLLGE